MEEKIVSPVDAAKKIMSGDRIFMAPGSCAPKQLADEIAKRKEELKDVRICTGLSMYSFDFFKRDFIGHIGVDTIFLSPYERMFLKEGNINVTSVSFSEYKNKVIKDFETNVLIMAVSSPNEKGEVSFGHLGVIVNKACMEQSRLVIAEINKNIPFVEGEDTTTHLDKIDYVYYSNEPIAEYPNPPISTIDKQIAEHIIPLINDGDCLQVGIGGTTNAVAYGLIGKKDLGIYTELLPESLVYLMKEGVVTGKRKNYLPNKVVTAFAVGNKEFYEFINYNKDIVFLPSQIVNNALEIAKNDNMISINNAIMIDLLGQVASEGVGYRPISGIGGQLDYIIGANLSKGGKSFMLVPSVREIKGKRVSSIVLNFPIGTPISTPRSLIEYVVTEYGVAYLKNKDIVGKAKALINISHPDFREELTNQAIEVGLIV